MLRPPHVAVEVLSAGQGLPFMRRKAVLYASFGVESVWIVHLERRVVHVIEGGSERTLAPGQRLTTAAVPGLDSDVAAFFPLPGLSPASYGHWPDALRSPEFVHQTTKERSPMLYELRQYTMKPGKQAGWIKLMEEGDHPAADRSRHGHLRQLRR